jgi:hypothetical protein
LISDKQSKINLMEYETEPLSKERLAPLFEAQAQKVLKPILSPLEEKALQNLYKPFTFRVNGLTIYISDRACKRLLKSTETKVLLLNDLVYKEKICKDIPLKHREAFEDPKIILSLPPRLRNELCRLECYCLLTVMVRGRKYFSEEQKFSSNAMKILDGLFARYQCGSLF